MAALPSFDNELVLRFVRSYRDNQCLWDFSSPAYKNKAARDEAYERLVRDVGVPGLTVSDVKNKIKNIRSTYCQELKKIQTAKLLGRDPYVPSVFWFRELDSFLHANTTPRTDLVDRKVPKYLKPASQLSNNILKQYSVVLRMYYVSFRCSKWISNCGREEFRYLTPRELGKKRICDQHFDELVLSNDTKTGLLRNAIPKDCRRSSMSEGTAAVCNEEPESGINTAESSDNTENELNCPKESSILCSALINAKEIVQRSNDSEEKYFSPDYKNVNGKITNSNKNTNRNCNIINKTTSNLSAVLCQNSTKFHNQPLQTPPSDFYYQQCQSADETNNSFPEPADGELPLFVQQEYDTSEAEDPVNFSVASEPLPKKVKYDKDSGDLANLVKETVKQFKLVTSTVVTNSEDEFEVFGKSVAIQLKKMSLCTALTVQSKIQDLLSEYRIKDINNSKHKHFLTDRGKCISLVNINGEENKNSSKDEIVEPNEENEDDVLNQAPKSTKNSAKSVSPHSDNEMVE